MAYCRDCGTEVDFNAAFCSSCGVELGYGESPDSNPSPEQHDDPEPPTEDSREERQITTENTDQPPEREHENTEKTAKTTTTEIPEPESGREPEEPTTSSSTTDDPSPPGIFLKAIGVLCVPVAALGIILEVLVVLTAVAGGYTTIEFVLAAILFGMVAIVPSAFLYYLYRRMKAVRTEGSE